ncbi:MAG TPA: DUF4157 domain-containing protein [Jatrophihabitans sp.]|uniref:eCIS core domain-containing protein n=1 Tax=Jatrophihabitans sp. TaxID=1932789 RepID=UPI002EE187A2
MAGLDVAGLGVAGLAVAGGAGPLLRELSGAADPLGGNPIPDGVLSALRRRKGGGRPLTPGMATEIGQQLGPAASAARIHTDGEADHIARSVQSVAFSYGSDVYFTQGAYSPDSQSGQRLLAHELSHVRQSATGSSGGGPIVGAANDPAEHEADRSADQVLGALRRQAVGRGTPACDHASHPEHSGHLAVSVLARTTLASSTGELVRRAYTEQERPGILQLAQLENSQERLIALEAHNWSSADTIALASRKPAPTYAELNSIMAKLTAAQLAQIQPSCASLAEVLALVATAWPAADLARHAAFDPRPTAPELQAVIAFFTPEQVDYVMNVSSSWADIVGYAGSGWSAEDLAGTASIQPAASVSQFRTIVSRFSCAQLDKLMEPSAFTWDKLTELAEAAEPDPQSPALTLKDVLVACNSLIKEDVAALDELGLKVSARRYQALVIGTDSLTEIDYSQVMDYLKDARWFSICFDTAQRLFDDLGDVAANSSDGARDAKYAQADQRKRAHLLETHLLAASAGGTPMIFNIHMGGHGFSLTVIGTKVYQLEAFASHADDDADVLKNFEDLSASLVTSIRSNNTYGIAEVTAAIVDMTSTSRKKRTAAAQVMGWNPGPCGFIDLKTDTITDPMAIWWESASLHSNAQIVTNIALRIQRQRAEIRKKFGIKDDDDA